MAAASGLTIPLSISLSDIKLSAFIILVFSKQKGLTVVFRNDPLESLKVSSTFDSIQFVRDYLQRTIEQQLRNLMMDELPAIIHRLSVQLWCPDQAQKGTETPEETDETGINPFASPPADPVDSHGNVLDLSSLSDMGLQGLGEMQSLFSQKNLLRLAALTDSHRTLSLFTPGINDVVFRAWSAHSEHSDMSSPAVATPSLAKTYSLGGGASTTYTFSDTGSGSQGYFPSRPALSLQAGHSGLAGHSHSRSRPGRKKKTRVVNLRKSRSEAPTPDNMSDTTETGSVHAPMSEPLIEPSIPEDPEAEQAATEDMPASTVRFSTASDGGAPSLGPVPFDLVKRLQDLEKVKSWRDSKHHPHSPLAQVNAPSSEKGTVRAVKEKAGPAENSSDTSSVILEQAWIMKMAGEIARRVYDEKQRRQGIWEEGSEAAPPPTYEAATH